MKITIATGPIFPVPAVRGGAVQRLWEGLAREFVKRGHEVTIFAREFPGQAKDEVVDGIRFVRRGGYAQSTSIKRDLVQCLIYALKTARHVPPGDVVVTNDFWMPAVLPWLQPSVGKVVVNANRFPKKQYWLYSKCAAFAAVSGAVASALREQTPSAASRVAIVPNAVDEVFLEETKRLRDQETKRPKDEESKRPKDDGTNGQPSLRTADGPKANGLRGNQLIQETGGGLGVRILYVGRIHPEKGLGLLAEALRLLADRDQRPKDQKTNRLSAEAADWECVLVGPVAQGEGGGGEAFAAKLKRQLQGLPVRLEAPVFDPEALAKIYDEADVFVYPSVAETGESFGIAPLEAMARGVVPVVSDLAVFRDYLEPGVNGMVFDHRNGKGPANLARVLDELVADADKRRRLGAAARTTVERFSPAAIADKYLQLFEKVVSGT
jgi:glycosyltransferase involved in cell wall biosynthesis